MIVFKNENDRQAFAQKMKLWDKEYDEKVRMVWRYRGKNGYHSQLSDCMVHPNVCMMAGIIVPVCPPLFRIKTNC